MITLIVNSPVTSHQQAFNLLPWRADYLRYRWRQCMFWLGGGMIVLLLWLAGLLLLYNSNMQHYKTHRQKLADAQHHVTVNNTPTRSLWLQKQAGLNAWHQLQTNSQWLGTRLMGMQHLASDINGRILNWQLQPKATMIGLQTQTSGQIMQQNLQLPKSLELITTQPAASNHLVWQLQLEGVHE